MRYSGPSGPAILAVTSQEPGLFPERATCCPTLKRWVAYWVMAVVLFEGDKPARCAGALVLEGLARHPGCHVGLRLGWRKAVALPDLGDELRLVLDLGQVQIRERRPFLLGIRPVSCQPSQGALTLAAPKCLSGNIPLKSLWLLSRRRLHLERSPSGTRHCSQPENADFLSEMFPDRH